VALVLIEGIAGTGKSCLTRALKNELTSLGADCCAIEENDKPHPIRQAGTVGSISPQQFIERTERRWRDLLESELAAVTVIDAALLQYSLGTLLCDDVQTSMIDAAVMGWFAMLNEYGARLVYLTQPSVRRTVERTRADRGPAWWTTQTEGIDGIPYGRKRGGDPDELLVSFVESMRDHSDRYAALWPGPLLSIDTERTNAAETCQATVAWLR
jgi:hypothetical protein